MGLGACTEVELLAAGSPAGDAARAFKVGMQAVHFQKAWSLPLERRRSAWEWEMKAPHLEHATGAPKRAATFSGGGAALGFGGEVGGMR